MREKLRLETLIGRGGFGPTVSAGKLVAGATGQSVIDLRNRLIVMGFLPRSATQTYDDTIVNAVQRASCLGQFDRFHRSDCRQ